MTKSKYNNIKTTVDGIPFDSIKEAKRYAELKLLQRGNIISSLETQVKFEIIPRSKYGQARYYIADFTYIENGEKVVEDVKSKATLTPVYNLKKRLIAEKYDIKIREIY